MSLQRTNEERDERASNSNHLNTQVKKSNYSQIILSYQQLGLKWVLVIEGKFI